MRQTQAHTLRKLLVQKLQALLYIETRVARALPRLARAASDEELKNAFRKHLDETEIQERRLRDAFKLLGEPPRTLAGEAIQGLVSDGQWVMKNVKGKEALDTNLIAAARYVEHYEMAGYLSAIDWAKALGEKKVVNLLEASLEEEEKADLILARISRDVIKQVEPGTE